MKSCSTASMLLQAGTAVSAVTVTDLPEVASVSSVAKRSWKNVEAAESARKGDVVVGDVWMTKKAQGLLSGGIRVDTVPVYV